MPLYKIDVEKQIGTEYWTNVYHVDGADLGDATAAGDHITQAERTFHRNTVLFTKTRVTALAAGDDSYTTLITGGTGELVQDTPSLPLFNVMRVDIQADTGRPSRKYYRLPVCEGDQNNGLFTPEFIAFMLPLLAPMYAGGDAGGFTLVDVDGQPLGNPQVFSQVGMRQLRRGSKRRTTPVLR